MDKVLRENLDKLTRDLLSSAYSRYWRDSDDSDLFLDVVMQWLQNTFGVGEILEYISIGLSARKTDSEEVKNDMNRVVELLHEVMDALPPHEFNLFGEEATPKEKQRFKELVDIYEYNKPAFIESIVEELGETNSIRTSRFLADVLHISSVHVYSLEEDWEMLKRKYEIDMDKKLSDFDSPPIPE